MNLKQKIRVIEDFPKKGISFKDITTLIKDGKYYRYTIKALADLVREKQVDLIASPEARGFIIGAPLAYELGVGFVPARKRGKLPGKTIKANYELEYGSDIIEMHDDAIKPGQKVIVADDLLATGGTIDSTVKLVEELGGIITAVIFLIELTELNGRESLSKYDVISLIKY
ncbi:MAG TPA: adenine phosphoribosyltransferase [Thermoanaerobacterales bacterium]|jgi:adenine phosphoribosyltransferase|nr:adenine phosphoribosyltransferase [Thermoanaerobacterales bacterium]